MSYVGNKPAQTTIPADDAVTTAMLQDDAVTADKVANAINTSIAANTSKVTNATHSGDVTGATALTIAAGAVDVAMLSATGSASSSTVLYGDGTWKTEPVTDTSPLLNDIATLALHSAVQNNQAAYNLSNAFVDQFEDDSGIDAESGMERSSDEYMASIIPGTIDSNTLLLLHMDGSDSGTTFTDSSPSPLTVTANSNVHTDTSVKKFGTASAQFDGTGDYLSVGSVTSWFDLNTYTDACIDFWVYSDFPDANNRIISTSSSNVQGYMMAITSAGGYDFLMGNGSNWGGDYISVAGGNISDNTWTHLAVVKQGSTVRGYVGGVQRDTGVWQSGDSYLNHFYIGKWGYFSDTDDFTGYVDEFRVSNVVRFPDGTTFTPPTMAYPVNIVNASGNYTSTTEAAAATVSTMGIVVLYKNAYGTATLDTDLIAQVSSNGGTNYTSAPLTAAGTFSTGINIAVANGVTISNTGTTPKYKISVANQAESSKETQVHGVALLY